jgi:hypothetical protein
MEIYRYAKLNFKYRSWRSTNIDYMEMACIVLIVRGVGLHKLLKNIKSSGNIAKSHIRLAHTY